MRLIAALCFILLQSFNITAVLGISASKKKCADYREMFPKLSGVFNDRDEDAALKEFPFMARIENGTGFFSNGILVSENFVLTVASNIFAGQKYVFLGDRDMNAEFDIHSQRFEVIKEFVHPLYSKYESFDLKLMKLNVSAKFDDYVRPACLPQPESEISHLLTEIGWSTTNVRDNSLLHKVKLYYISNAMCKDKLKIIEHQKPLMEEIDNGPIFCGMTSDGDRDLCNGFFGAALLNHDRNKYTLSEVMGIATTNTGCEETFPTVFVRLSESLDWIESIVWPEIVVATTPSPPAPITSTTFIKFLPFVALIAILLSVGCVIVIWFKIKKSSQNRGQNGQDLNVTIRLRH